MATQDQELVRAFSHADEATRAARMRGWELPAEWVEAKAVVAAAEVVLREPEPALSAVLPDPKKLPDFCTKLARDRAEWRGRVEVAREVHDLAQKAAARAGLAAAPAVTARLITEANERLVPAFTELLVAAPRSLTGHEAPEQLSLHAELLKASEQLTAAAYDRASLAIATGESEDLGRGGDGWLYLAPVASASVFDVAAAIERIAHDGLPTTVADWAQLTRIGVRFAAAGEAAQRYEQFNRARAHAGNAPDGGMRDRSYSALLAAQPVNVAG